MAKVIGLEKANETMGHFSFSEFRIVREFRFYECQEEDLKFQKFDLVVESENRTPNFRLKLRFTGVSGLTIKEIGGGESQIIGLDVIDISRKQWEYLNWEVSDYEDDVIHFFAKAVEIVSLEKTE